MSIAKPYLISNTRTGLERDLEPWLIPADAYPDLEDCYMFRGRIPRRKGYNFLGRIVSKVVNENMGNANGASFSGTLAHTNISPGSVSIAVGVIAFTDNGAGVLVGIPGTNSGTINYITGAIALAFAPPLGAPTAVIVTYEYYNLNPVMGLRTRELSVINEEQLVAFDTVKANAFSNTNLRFQDISQFKTTGTAFSWSATDSDFFWTTNYLNAFWATNGTRGFQDTGTSPTGGRGDGLRWYDGTGWVNFLPAVDAANFLMGGRIIVSYRNRLVVLNTTEGTAYGAFTNYPQRARWSQNGTVYPTTDPLGNALPVPSGYTGGQDNIAWRSDQVGKGGYIDAPTQEQIVSAEFYKDVLVVFFERSTWQLRYTGNETLPFIWERINVDFGGESTFSVVPFDLGIIAVGNYGIVSCDATGVKRIDQIIPDEVFQIHNGNSGVKRVYGIRDFTKQLVYWTFPSEEQNPTYPNRVLVFNYLDQSYSFFNDSLTCFGYYQAFNDTTWADLNRSWQATPFQWDSAVFQSDYPSIVAGNQQGFVFNNFNDGGVFNSASSLYISGATQANPCVITSANHNLLEGQIIQISGVAGMTQLNGNKYRVSKAITSTTFVIQSYNSTNDLWENVNSTAYGAYTNGGLILVRNNPLIATKRFNPFLETGLQVRLQNVDLFLEGTSESEMTLNIYIDENSNTAIESKTFSSDTTTGQEKVWTRIYTSSIGQFVQLELTFSNAQIIDDTKSGADFVLHAIMPWFSASGRLTYGITR